MASSGAGEDSFAGHTGKGPEPSIFTGHLVEALRTGRAARPVDCLLWDVEHGHWRSSWGERPSDLLEAVETARLRLADAPSMAPLYAHRFLPAGRGTYGHPVLSMRGWDTIYYGTDLADYINQEFQEPRPERDEEWQPHATVPFWRDYL